MSSASNQGLAVELHDVRKSFGKTEIIRGADLQVRAGERVAIIGPNGAGKSTLFRLIQGVEQPDSGEVVVGKTAKLAFVDQSREGLAADKTVWEDVSGGLDNIVVGKFVMPSRALDGAASTSSTTRRTTSSSRSPTASRPPSTSAHPASTTLAGRCSAPSSRRWTSAPPRSRRCR